MIGHRVDYRVGTIADVVVSSALAKDFRTTLADRSHVTPGRVNAKMLSLVGDVGLNVPSHRRATMSPAPLDFVTVGQLFGPATSPLRLFHSRGVVRCFVVGSRWEDSWFIKTSAFVNKP